MTARSHFANEQLEQDLAALAERLDALPRLGIKDLRRQWQKYYRTTPPKRMTRDLLVLAVAWKIQEKAYGGLSASAKRKLSELNAPDNTADTRTIQLKPGAKLVREWNGKIHEVLVREDGFEWQSKIYGSLSKIAGEITNAHWSGPKFFGLKPRPKPFDTVRDAGE